MQSVLSVPLTVTEQSFTASPLIRVSGGVTSSGIGRNIHERGWDFFFEQFLSACTVFLEPCRQKIHTPIYFFFYLRRGGKSMQLKAGVIMSATTQQSSLLNNWGGDGFWGVVHCLPLFVWMAKLISGDYPQSISAGKLHIWTDMNPTTKNKTAPARSHNIAHTDIQSPWELLLCTYSLTTCTYAHTHTPSHTQIHPGVSAVSQTYHQLRPFVQFCLIGSPAACSISTLQSFCLQSQ